jgi:hypothetical protein
LCRCLNVGLSLYDGPETESEKEAKKKDQEKEKESKLPGAEEKPKNGSGKEEGKEGKVKPKGKKKDATATPSASSSEEKDKNEKIEKNEKNDENAKKDKKEKTNKDKEGHEHHDPVRAPFPDLCFDRKPMLLPAFAFNLSYRDLNLTLRYCVMWYLISIYSLFTTMKITMNSKNKALRYLQQARANSLLPTILAKVWTARRNLRNRRAPANLRRIIGKTTRGLQRRRDRHHRRLRIIAKKARILLPKNIEKITRLLRKIKSLAKIRRSAARTVASARACLSKSPPKDLI